MAGDSAVRYGFRTAGYSEMSLTDALGSIGRVGYDGVEFCLEHPQARPGSITPSRAAQIKTMIADAGLQLASVSYHGDFEPREERAQNQERAIEITRQLGSDVLILNASKAEAGREADQWDAFVAQLERLLPLAQSAGVFLALEPEPGHFLDSSADMLRLLRQVGHANLAVNLDVGHAYLTDPDVGTSIRELGDAIVHTHIEGMPAGEHKHLVPGEGDLDLGAVHGALESVGFDGYYTVDLFRITDDPEDYARRSLLALREIIG